MIAPLVLVLVGCATSSDGQLAAQDATPIVEKGFIYDEAPYPEAHASTIVQLSDGRIAASWFGGTKERNPDVSIWYVVQESGIWGEPVMVATGEQPDGSRLPTWNPVLYQVPDGDLILFYKIGPNPREWWGMKIASSDGGATWSAPERLPDGILGPIKNKPVTLEDGTIVSPTSIEGDMRDGWSLYFERSEDGGKTWAATHYVETPEGIDAIQPSILFHEDGRLQALARTRQGNVAMSWSDDDGLNWTPVAATVLPNPNSGTDAVTLADGRQLIVYNPTAHNPETPGKGYRYPIRVAVSDDGLAWQDVATLDTEALPSGYAYPSVIQSADGMVHITYTHNRERITHVVLDPTRF
ncbi:MAG: sialidase [Ponticaulis sp.]|nr:sialidase [Ponticaulis sp.]